MTTHNDHTPGTDPNQDKWNKGNNQTPPGYDKETPPGDDEKRGTDPKPNEYSGDRKKV